MMALPSVRAGSRCIPALVLALLLAAPAAAQDDDVDAFVRGQLQSQRIPGLSLVVLKAGEVVKAAGYGVADRERGTPATPETVYKIASVSKQFIAAGVMLLVQEGRLGLDDALVRYLEGAPAAWSGITIRHLLTHTAGLVREAPGFAPDRMQSDADVIASAYGVPLRFPPGERWEYSNTGYFALAEVIRVVAGRPWPEFLAGNIFAPAGMRATRTTTTEHVPGAAVGYTDNDRLLVAPEWAAVRPSGAFLSTVLDLAKWDVLLDAGTILADSTRRQMWTPVALADGTTWPYGFGWQLAPLGGRSRVFHHGGMPGFRAGYARFPDDRVTVIVLMNLDDVDIDTIVNGIAAFYVTPAGSRTRRRSRAPRRRSEHDSNGKVYREGVAVVARPRPAVAQADAPTEKRCRRTP